MIKTLDVFIPVYQFMVMVILLFFFLNRLSESMALLIYWIILELLILVLMLTLLQSDILQRKLQVHFIGISLAPILSSIRYSIGNFYLSMLIQLFK